MIAFRVKGGVKDPVAVAALKENLFAGFGIDGPDRVVGTAEGNFGPVRRPCRAVDGVEGDGSGESEFPS